MLFRNDQRTDSVKSYIARIEQAANLVKTIASNHLIISDSFKAMIILMCESGDQHVVDTIDASNNETISSESMTSILLRHKARDPQVSIFKQGILALKAEVVRLRSRPSSIGYSK